MRRVGLLLLVVLDVLAAGLLWAALARADELVLDPLPLRGAPMAGAAPRRAREVLSLHDDEGRVRLAALAVPGYDPPELRADPSPLGADGLPEEIAALAGTEVTVRGYPLPYESGPGGTTAVLLSRNPPGCCFGLRPVLDEWIEVRGEKAFPGLDPARLATFRGVLEVGEVQDEEGYAQSLYRMPGAVRAD